jgi:hypothetical protein
MYLTRAPTHPLEQGPSQDRRRQRGRQKKRRPEPREANMDFSWDQSSDFRSTNLSRKWASTQSTFPGERKNLRKVNGRAKRRARSPEVRGNRRPTTSCSQEAERTAVSGSKDLTPSTESRSVNVPSLQPRWRRSYQLRTVIHHMTCKQEEREAEEWPTLSKCSKARGIKQSV